ncbi:MerR family transcriptional regulator [Streptomyces sp. NPDC001568]|uniref:MerR family transcriptional regulator n=1 Tax=Streptomyces sp. NPDC001568 TaxID=3364588 RepID=UPI0036A286C7
MAREYRTAELAEAAGIPVRTLRFYRERKLLPPPRREGRIAWYEDHHLARLRTIAALLERGHTLGGIAELIAAFENGRDVGQLGELLGMGWSEETPVRLTPEALADHFEGEVTPENLAASLDLGYLAVDGEAIVHVSRRLLDVSSALVREGVPLAAVLETGRRVREHADAMAALFTELISTHLSEESLPRLRPLAKSVVEAELTMAMDRLLASNQDPSA